VNESLEEGLRSTAQMMLDLLRKRVASRRARVLLFDPSGRRYLNFLDRFCSPSPTRRLLGRRCGEDGHGLAHRGKPLPGIAIRRLVEKSGQGQPLRTIDPFPVQPTIFGLGTTVLEGFLLEDHMEETGRQCVDVVRRRGRSFLLIRGRTV
jgi:hypothetical protein